MCIPRSRKSESATTFPASVAFTPYDETFVEAMKAFEETRRKYRNALRELGT